jgi:hypothetical protein
LLVIESLLAASFIVFCSFILNWINISISCWLITNTNVSLAKWFLLYGEVIRFHITNVTYFVL